MYFREIVFKITIDIEHLLKVQLLSHSQKNESDDGYQIVEDFLKNNTDIRTALEQHSFNGYNSALIQKYQSKYPIGNNVSKYLWSARILRNAAAHIILAF